MVPWGVAGSIAGLLPGAAVDRESPFAGVAAVRFPHALFIQETNLSCRRLIKHPVHVGSWVHEDIGTVAKTLTCTSMDVVSSTTLFMTARTFLGSMVLTQSLVSTLFLNIWEIIRP